ncbi:MAG: phage tail protein [Chloroflexota bacterium]|jgi:phage tail-like protein
MARNIVDTARTDPLVSFHFGVDLGGRAIGYFTECSGLGSETEIIEQKVVNESGQEVVLKVPGRLKWENIVLKRGITENLDIWEWRKEVTDGGVKNARLNGSIVMYDQEGGEVARWNFEQGWPAKVTGPQPKADSNEIGIEEMTISHEYIERVS